MVPLDLETPIDLGIWQMPGEAYSALHDKDASELTEEEQAEVFLEGMKALWQMRLGRREPEMQQMQGIFAPWEEDGELVGILVSTISEGGIFDQLGIQQRDVVHSVNGVRVRAEEDVGELMQRVTHDTVIRIDITREGDLQTIESRIPPHVLEDLSYLVEAS